MVIIYKLVINSYIAMDTALISEECYRPFENPQPISYMYFVISGVFCRSLSFTFFWRNKYKTVVG